MNYGSMSGAMRRLVTAREKVAAKSEWFGGIIYSAPLVEKTIGTMATDGINIYADANFVAANDPFIEGVFLHEVLHVALDHVSRRKWRKHRLWNQACDYAINPLVKRLFPLPPDALLDPRFDNMRAEAIYDVLAAQEPPKGRGRGNPGDGEPSTEQSDGGDSPGDGDDDQDQDQDQQGKGGSDADDADDDQDQDTGGGAGDDSDDGDDEVDSKPKDKGKSKDKPASGDMLEPPSQAELDKARAKMRDAVSRATEKCEKAGTMPSQITAVLKDLVPSEKLDWRKLLEEWARNARDHTSLTWRRPNRRSIASGNYRPGYEQTKIHKLVACIDCSGSINDKWAKEMKAELISLVEQGLVNSVHLIATDTRIVNEAEVTTAEEIEAFPVGRGGGTDFDDCMERVAEINDAMGCVFLTDMQTMSFGRDPDMPVVWVDWTKDGKQKVPFGKVCAL